MIPSLSFIPSHFYRRHHFCQKLSLIQMHAFVSYSMHLIIKHDLSSFVPSSLNYTMDSTSSCPSLSSILPSLPSTSTSTSTSISNVHPLDSMDNTSEPSTSPTSSSLSPSSSSSTSSLSTISCPDSNSCFFSKDIESTPSLNQENATLIPHPSSASSTSTASKTTITSSLCIKASKRSKLKKRKNSIPSSPFVSLSPFCAPYQPSNPPTIHSFSDGQGVPHRELISYLWKLFLNKDYASMRSFIVSCFTHPSFLAAPLTQFTLQDWKFFLYACFLSHRFSDMHRLWMTFNVPWSPFILNLMLASYVRSHLTDEVLHLFQQIRERHIRIDEPMLFFVSMGFLPSISLQRKCRTVINRSIASIFARGTLDHDVLDSVSDPVLAIELQKCIEQVTHLFSSDLSSKEKMNDQSEMEGIKKKGKAKVKKSIK